jgi:hypothetical protein
VPDDRVEVVEPDLATHHADVCVEWHDDVASVIPSREADVAHDANETSPGHKNPVRLAPYIAELLEKLFVVGHVPHLRRTFIVPLECPVRRRCDHEVN